MVYNGHSDHPTWLSKDASLHVDIAQSTLLSYENQGRIPTDSDAFMVLLPILIILSTMLFVLLLFLICVLLLRHRRGISLRDYEGPIDVSREDSIDADGGLATIEDRWLDSVPEDLRRTYRQAKLYETQYPPNSFSTDITLSQFLTIQEKGVSAWSFEPEYEALPAVLVHARTELTFLPDPSACSSVQSNLPIPKLNEVYYWEVKMFDLPTTTNVAVGLATKPYPTFRLPGWNRYSVAYHSNGDKSYNYPFTATPFGPSLREGDVLGVGYRPRTGTVFFTRNGRKTEEAFAGLSRWNLFPTIGADGPCSVHVNLGQAGFVFIEANVKKWGLAPSVGTLAPPPAYGSERGSILLEAGGVTPRRDSAGNSTASTSSRRFHRLKRPRAPTNTTLPANPSPLRNEPISPPPPFSPGGDNEQRLGVIDRLRPSTSRASSQRAGPSNQLSPIIIDEEAPSDESSISSRTARAASPRGDLRANGSPLSSPQAMSPQSPYPANPPTPNVSDIHLRTLERTSSSPRGSRRGTTSEGSTTSGSEDGHEAVTMGHGGPRQTDPPEYAVINPHIYASGVNIDLPAEVIQAALDGRPVEPPSSPDSSRSGRGVRR